MKKLSFLFAALVAGVFGLSANAEVLVSEGCDTTKDYTSVSASGSGLLGNYPKSWTANIGIMKDKKWSGYGSQPKAYPYDLPLPECFAAAGITSKGAACVGHNSGANQTDHRWGYLALATDKLKIASGTTIYLALRA